MAHEPAPFQTSITYVGGRLVVVSREGEGYRFALSQLAHMLSFFDLMMAWAKSKPPPPILVGPYACTPTGACDVALPFQLGDGSTIHVRVAHDWLELMHPLFVRATEKIAEDPDQPFTLALAADSSIEELPPERATLRPA